MRKAGSSDVAVILATLNEEKGVGATLRELRVVLEGPYCLLVGGNSVDEPVVGEVRDSG